VLSVQIGGAGRTFGYLVGDVLETDAVITAKQGTHLDRQSLPIPGPLNAAIELRGIAAVERQEGGYTQIRIHAEYQNFLAPERVTETETPGYVLQVTTDTARFVAKIPAWSFQVSPLRVAQQSVGDIGELRPNHAIAPVDERDPAVRLAASALVACAAALAFAGGQGWLAGRRRGNRPFAIAASHIARTAPDGDSQYQALHRAFDATAGRPVFACELNGFFETHPRFGPLREDVARFFSLSEQRFFAPGGETVLPSVDLLKLAKSLRRLERRR